MIHFLKFQFNGKFRNASPGTILVRIFLLLIITSFLFTLFFKFFESSSWEEAVWQSWQTISTVGYGNAPAQTFPGRLFSILIGTIGIALLGTLFSSALDYKIQLQNKWRFGMVQNPIKDGYIIFNFPGEYKFINFINEIRTKEHNIGVCIVDNSLEQLPKQVALMGNIHFIKGNTISKETYEKSGLSNNKAVIVFPLESSKPESDAATKTTVELICQFTTDKTRIMHILVDPNNGWMFETNRSTQILESIEMLALVQECQDRFSAEVIKELLLNSVGANLKTLSLSKLQGMTWGEFCTAITASAQKNSETCTPLALIQGEVVNTSPQYSTTITADDFVSLIVNHSFIWEQYEALLSAAKT